MQLELQTFGAGDEELADAGAGDAAHDIGQPKGVEALALGLEVEGGEGEMIDPAAAAHAGGAGLQIARLAIDTGYEAPAVYAWSRRQGFAQVAPVKGVEGFSRASPVSGPTYVDVTDGGKRLRRGARLWTVAVSIFKAETYRFLRLSTPTDEEIAAGAKFPVGYVHLARGTEAEWVKQLVGEQLVTVKTGHPKSTPQCLDRRRAPFARNGALRNTAN